MRRDLEGETGRALRVSEERLRLALEGTQTGFWEWDIEADEITWSENLGPLHGLPRGTQPGGYETYIAGINDLDRGALQAKVRNALETGEGYIHETRIVLGDGTHRWLHSRAHVVPGPDGSPALLVGVTADVTERHQREDGLAFLAEASQTLAGSVDPVKTLEEIAQLAVPRLADWCVVQLAADGDGSFENVAVAHVDPEKVSWARELEERYPPDADSPNGAPQVIRSGRSELYPVIDEALLASGAKDDEHLQILRELSMSSAMVVPLKALDRTLGAITFIAAESGRQYSAPDVELAEEVGRRAGLALDHARLYAREHATAETLQRALLPARLPELPGHRLAVRYVPSREGDHVGGDWYDAFALAGGCFGIVIGDVGGRGISAAAYMGQLRNALRAYALKAPGPGPAVDDLHALTDALGEVPFATLAYVVYDARTGEGRFASAGHLPLLLLDAAGGATYLAGPRCPPLGAGSAGECAEERFTLGPGGRLLLFTDGLVERRERSLDDGLAALAEVARTGAPGAEELADRVLAAMGGEHDDDVALLALERE